MDESEKKRGGLIAVGLGALVAAGLAAYFLSKKEEPPPPGGGGGGGGAGAAATAINGFAYSCSPGSTVSNPCATGSVIVIDGQLVNASGVPIAGATIRIVVTNAGGSVEAKETTDQTGRFSLSAPIISQTTFNIQAVFDGDATKSLAGSVSSKLTIVSGPATCEVRQFYSGPLSYQTQYVVDLVDATLVKQIEGSWRKGGDFGTALLRAIFDDGSSVDLTGCVQPHSIGTIPPTQVNKFTRFVRFLVVQGAPCSLIGLSYMDQVDANLLTCHPGGPTQTCAAQGGTCISDPDRCSPGVVIPSTDCTMICCRR